MGRPLSKYAIQTKIQIEANLGSGITQAWIVEQVGTSTFVATNGILTARVRLQSESPDEPGQARCAVTTSDGTKYVRVIATKTLKTFDGKTYQWAFDTDTVGVVQLANASSNLPSNIAGVAVLTTFASATGTAQEPEPTQMYSMDFASTTYEGPSGAVADPFASLFTHSRSTPILVPNAAGTYQSFATNVPAINDLGLWLRGETRTNLIRNNSMVGAAAGAPGTIPTLWVMGGLPAGITREIPATGPADPHKGLPYIDFRFYGTSTGNANLSIQTGATAGAATQLNELHMHSVWLAIVGGSIPLDNTSAIRVQTIYAGSSNQSVGALGTSQSKDRVMARDTTPRRIKHLSQALTSNAVQPIAVKHSIFMAFKAGVTYDFTLRIIAPQLELVPDTTSDASLPILTTTANVTHNADSLVLNGAMLALTQGTAAGIEVKTRGLRCSGLDFRKTVPILVANGSVNLLERTNNGEISSALSGSAKTYRAYRTQYDWEQEHRVQWNSNSVAVASTSPAHKAVALATVPTITSIAIKADGCVSKLVVDDSFKTDLTKFTNLSSDIGVYGATSGGIVAAASAIEAGKTARVYGGWREVVPGGMAAGGLGAVDASVATLNEAFGGMSLDYARWVNEYVGNGSPDNKSIQAAHAVLFFDYLLRKHKINMHWTKGVSTANKLGAKITAINTVMGQRFTAEEFIECGYEGDLLAAANVSHRVGREAADANNAFNGNAGINAYTSTSAGLAEHQLTPSTGAGHSAILAVDPWIVPGNPASGLIEGIQTYPVGTVGSADSAIQAYNFRITATRAANRVSFYPNGAPEGYSAARYELLGRWMAALTTAGWTAISIDGTVVGNQYNLGLFMLLNGVGSIYDINSNNGFSTDTFGANWGEGWAKIMTDAGIVSPSANYAVGTYEEREIFWKWQESHIRGLFYYLGESGDSRIPNAIRDDAKTFGLDPTYYLDPHENDSANWMTQLYVREARALQGQMILEAADVSATDGTTPRSTNVIAMGSYSIDSHHVRRYAVNDNGTWKTICEGNIFVVVGGNKKFPIAMEYIMPAADEASNLLVTFAASAKHTGFGALRMEMAHMAMSEAAALMAVQRITNNTSSSGAIDYSALRTAMLGRNLVVDQTN